MVPGREDSEKKYYEELGRQEKRAYTIIGGGTSVDKIAQKYLKTEYHQVHLDSKINFNRRDHISAIGNYVVLTRISKSLAQRVDEAYQTIPDEKTLAKKFGELFKNPGPIVMVVECNEQKARRLREKIAPDFHVPSELRKKFSLF